jgi:hypothetical protein
MPDDRELQNGLRWRWKMEVFMSQSADRKAAQAGRRAKRGFLVVCVLLAASIYVSQEKRGAADAGGRAMHREMQDLMAHFAVRFDESAAAGVRALYYDKQDRIYCGEVNGRNSRGGEAKFRDGVRIFVCGPGVGPPASH